MRYSKLFILLLLILAGSNVCYAINWEAAFNGDKEIYIDRDSVNWHNDSLYYSIKYYDKKVGKYIIAIIQNKDNKTGIVSSCTDFQYNQNFINALTPKVATSFTPLNTSSLLFNANSRAIEINRDKQLQAEKEAEYNANQNKQIWSDNNDYNNTDKPDFAPYMSKLQRDIKRNWHPIKSSNENRVVVLFKIAKDGSLLSSEIFKTSGDENIDNEALNAVKKAAPFKPLPKEYNEESIEIQFSFDYHLGQQ